MPVRVAMRSISGAISRHLLSICSGAVSADGVIRSSHGESSQFGDLSFLEEVASWRDLAAVPNLRTTRHAGRGLRQECACSASAFGIVVNGELGVVEPVNRLAAAHDYGPYVRVLQV